MTKYRLYKLPFTAENLELADEKYRFFRATPGKDILVYTDKRKPAGATLIRNAAEIVGNVITEWLGDDLTLWQNEGSGATAAST